MPKRLRLDFMQCEVGWFSEKPYFLFNILGDIINSHLNSHPKMLKSSNVQKTDYLNVFKVFNLILKREEI